MAIPSGIDHYDIQKYTVSGNLIFMLPTDILSHE